MPGQKFWSAPPLPVVYHGGTEVEGLRGWWLG